MIAAALASMAYGGTEVGSSRPFGLGIQLGSPAGLTGKFYTNSRKNAIDFTVGGGYYGGRSYWWDGFWIQASYHWHLETLASGNGVTIPFRIGVGGFVAGDYGPPGNPFAGARVPFGLDFDLERAPFQFYIEVAFELVILPPLYPALDAGIGARYYF